MPQRLPLRITPLLLAFLAIPGTLPSARATSSSFQDWLAHVRFSLPAFSIDTPWLEDRSSLTFARGNCSGLRIGSVAVQDHSVGPALHLTFKVSGVDLQCSLRGENSTISVDVALTSSWAGASVAVQPFHQFPKPLPVAVMMSDCTTGLQMSVVQFRGDSEAAVKLNATKTAVVDRLKARLADLLCLEVPRLVTNGGTNLLQNMAFIMSELLVPVPSPPLPQAVAPLVDWGAYPPVLVAREMLAERLPRRGRQALEPVRLRLGMHLDLTADFGIDLDALEVTGLDAVRASLLLTNGSEGLLGVAASAGHLSLHLASKLKVSPLQPHLQGLVQSLNVTVSVQDLFLFAQSVAMFSKPLFEALEVPQLQMPGCLVQCGKAAAAPPFGSIGLRELTANATSLRLLLGTSGSLAEDLAEAADTAVGALIRGYLPSFQAVFNGLSTYLLLSLNDRLWSRFDNETRYPCEHSDGIEGVLGDSALKGLWGASAGLALAGGAAAALAAAAAAAAAGPRRGGEARAAAVEGGGGGEGAGPASGDDLEARADVGAREDRCLAKSGGVPRALAVFFPFALVSVVFLFLFADLALGTSVDALVTAGGSSVTFGSLFTFSLASTIQKTWNARAYLISVLTLLFSGIWPLVKLALMLLAWLAPPSRISLKTRGMLLSFLDVWGKYSFLDSWLLVLCMSACAMEWQGGDASLKVQMRPTVAYYAFLLATVLSSVLGNVANYCHHRAEAARAGLASQSAPAAVSRRIPLGSYGRCAASHLTVAAALVLSIAVTGVGAWITSFQFAMSGLGASLIFQEQRHTESFSLIEAGTGVIASMPGDLGLVALQVVFLLISFAVPLMLLIALLVLWVLPLKANEQKGLLYACHVLDTSSTLDVFVLTVIVGHAGIGHLAGRLIATGDLKAVCSLVGELGLQCLQLDLQLLPGFALLLAAGLLALAVPKSVHQVCRATVEARTEKLRMQGEEEAAAAPGGGNHNGVLPSEGQGGGEENL